MSADNYYYIMHHPSGGFTTIMRWMSDERPVREVAPEDPRFLSFEEAYAYAATQYSEYGVRVSDEVLAEISGREFAEISGREYRKVDDGAGAFADELLAAREEFAEYVAKMEANLK